IENPGQAARTFLRPLAETGNCIGVARRSQCQTQRSVGCGGRDRDTGVNDNQKDWWQFGEGIDLLSPARAQSGSATEEKGRVGPQFTRQILQFRGGNPQVPETGEAQQRCCGIAAAPAKPGSHGYALAKNNLRALCCRDSFCQGPGSSPNQVILIPQKFRAVALEAKLPAWPELQLVAQVDALQDSTNLVEAIGTASQDRQG